MNYFLTNKIISKLVFKGGKCGGGGEWGKKIIEFLYQKKLNTLKFLKKNVREGGGVRAGVRKILYILFYKRNTFFLDNNSLIFNNTYKFFF